MVNERETQATELEVLASLMRGCAVQSEVFAVYLARIEALEAGAAALRQSSGWQPIESARQGPDEDGCCIRIILGFAPDEEGYTLPSVEGYWNSTLGRWVSTLDPNFQHGAQPTHWMPLPSSPEADTSQRRQEHDLGVLSADALESLAEMRRASDLVDEAAGYSEYNPRLVALALIAREFLRRVSDTKPEREG